MSPPIVQFNGWWWPAIDRDAHGVIMCDVASDIPNFLAHVEGRDVIVQAGGNVGVYAVALSALFSKVYTVEPDSLNYSCLVRNISERKANNIVFRQAALGDEPGFAEIDVVKASNVGAHRIAPGTGDIPIIRIDDLPLSACDAIWLDIEGYELAALKGAEETIRKFFPAISIEDKGLDRHFGVKPGEVQGWLADREYVEVARYGRDKVFKRMMP